MDPKEYVRNVLVTEARDFSPLQERFSQVRSIRLLHGIIGLSSELAEIQELSDKADIDKVNLKEEMGDLFWYMGIMIDELGFDPEQIFTEASSSLLAFEGDDYSKRMGLQSYITELVKSVGTAVDLLKKHLMYGKPLNTEGLFDQLKRTNTYIVNILNIYDMTGAEARATNIGKLKFRYQQKFTETAALNRDLETERKILESKGK